MIDRSDLWPLTLSLWRKSLSLSCPCCTSSGPGPWINKSPWICAWISNVQFMGYPLPFAAMRVFTALHEMQTRCSDENSVCLSVCQTRGLWQNIKNMSRFLYRTKDHLAYFSVFSFCCQFWGVSDQAEDGYVSRYRQNHENNVVRNCVFITLTPHPPQSHFGACDTPLPK